MATTARSRKRSPSTAPTLVTEERGGSRMQAIVDRLPRMALADRFQREILGVALVAVGALSGWALARGEQDGRLVAWWRDVLVAAYGVIGGWLVPAFLIMVAVRVFRDLDEPILRPHHYVGGFLLAIATLGLLEMGVGDGGFDPGGNLGVGVSTIAVDVLGVVASGIALYLIGTVAVLLLARMSPSRFYHEVRWLLPERDPRVAGHDGDGVVDDDFEAWPDDAPDRDERIGLLPDPADDATGARRHGRFRRGHGVAPSTDPVRAVGGIDMDLAILSPPVPSRGRRRGEATDEGGDAGPVDAPRSRGSRSRSTSGSSGDTSGDVRPLWQTPVAPVRPTRSAQERAGAPVAPPRISTPVRPGPVSPAAVSPASPGGAAAAPAAPDLEEDVFPFADERDAAPTPGRAAAVGTSDAPAGAADDPFGDEDEVFAPEPEPAAPSRRSRSGRTRVPASGEAVAATAAPAAPSPAPVTAATPEPVINVPVRQSREIAPPPAAVQAPLANSPAPARTPLGAPMPLPTLEHLPYYESHKPNHAELEAKARLIQEKLASFRVQAWVREINTGPAVTQFALEPGEGVKVRRITELQNDLALALAAPQIRIEAPVPGHARVGIEVPNAQIMTVGLRETLESPAFTKGKQKLPIPLGLDVNGKYIVGDLTRMPHLLIAGATGAGKSVCLNGIISTFLLTRRPDDVKLLMIDPKMVELSGYNGVPHLQAPVVTEMGKVVPSLRLVLREMERRYALFSQLGVRNLDGYRLKTADEPTAERIPYLVVIIDELADLMMTTPVEVESLLQRLTQMARATGIHLIIATQRPSVDVLTGIIKANVPARIAFMVSSGTDSRVILDVPGAERLLGKGDMLFLPPDAAKPQRIQGAFVADEDVPRLVEHWQRVVPVPQYAQEWIDLPTMSEDSGSGGGGDADDEDPLWDEAIEIVRKAGTASASMLQRRLRIGYNRAARLIQEMEDQHIIGPADGIRGRTVLLGAMDDDE